jgi:hypothetical protein
MSEIQTDTIHPSRVEVVNDKLFATSNNLSNFWVADDLVGFKKNEY